MAILIADFVSGEPENAESTTPLIQSTDVRMRYQLYDA